MSTAIAATSMIRAMVTAAWIGCWGALMVPHSSASSATAIHTPTRNTAPPHQTAASASGARTAADTALSLKLDQSKRLAGRKDVIDLGSAIATLAGPILGDRSAQRLWAVVGPKHVLEHQFGVGGLPQQEVGQPTFAGGADDQ